jgi:hypothetical protein
MFCSLSRLILNGSRHLYNWENQGLQQKFLQFMDVQCPLPPSKNKPRLDFEQKVLWIHIGDAIEILSLIKMTICFINLIFILI